MDKQEAQAYKQRRKEEVVEDVEKEEQIQLSYFSHYTTLHKNSSTKNTKDET